MISKQCVSMAGGQSICMGHCPAGKTFDIINSKSYVKYMWNCAKADFGIERMPDCVGKYLRVRVLAYQLSNFVIHSQSFLVEICR